MSERESRQYSSNVFICHITMYIEYRFTYTGMNDRIREREIDRWEREREFRQYSF